MHHAGVGGGQAAGAGRTGPILHAARQTLADEVRAVGTDRAPPPVALRAEGLTKRYGTLMAVNRLSLEVLEAEVFGLLGPNGAGKSTTINMLCGLLTPDAGAVTIQGRSIGHGEEIRLRVGLCPQETVLWDHLTCLEQLRFVGRMYGVDGRVAHARGRELLADLGQRLPVSPVQQSGRQRHSQPFTLPIQVPDERMMRTDRCL